MSKWIPEYKHADQIKIEYLLRQSSGIPDYFYDLGRKTPMSLD